MKDFKIERYKDGTIKDFSIPDAHTVYCTAYLVTEKGVRPKAVKREALTIPSLDSLETLMDMVDKSDGTIVGKKWALTKEVIRDLKSKGEASQFIPGHPLRFDYFVRKVKRSDQLRHKG